MTDEISRIDLPNLLGIEISYSSYSEGARFGDIPIGTFFVHDDERCIKISDDECLILVDSPGWFYRKIGGKMRPINLNWGIITDMIGDTQVWVRPTRSDFGPGRTVEASNRRMRREHHTHRRIRKRLWIHKHRFVMDFPSDGDRDDQPHRLHKYNFAHGGHKCGCCGYRFNTSDRRRWQKRLRYEVASVDREWFFEYRG